MPNSRDILYRVGYTRTLIDIASAGYEKEKAGTMAESLASRSTCSSSVRSHSAWWLLARHSDSQREVLTLTHGGSRAVTEHVGRGGGGARELKPRTFRESSGGHNSVAPNRCAVRASAHLLRHFSCPRGDQRVRYSSTLITTRTGEMSEQVSASADGAPILGYAIVPTTRLTKCSRLKLTSSATSSANVLGNGSRATVGQGKHFPLAIAVPCEQPPRRMATQTRRACRSTR